MVRAAQEFSRFAGTYERHNIIQKKVADKLVSMLPGKEYGSILDLGCGSGALYHNLEAQNISYRHLTAMDIAPKMLELHPSGPNIEKIMGDFNSSDDIKSLSGQHFDLLLSSSALQWSKELDRTVSMLSSLSHRYYLAIFTSGTFRSLHDCAGIRSPIFSETELKDTIGRYLNLHFETVNYTLHFDSVYKMFRYIKESGTSGGEKHLSYVQTKRLLDSYPHDYLEFEVLFAYSKS